MLKIQLWRKRQVHIITYYIHNLFRTKIYLIDQRVLQVEYHLLNILIQDDGLAYDIIGDIKSVIRDIAAQHFV